MAKKNYFRTLMNQNDVYAKTVQMYRNKYYNLYRAQFKWTGLNYRQEDYIMRRFWQNGTVAAFRIKNIDELGFAPWTLDSWDMYNLPETVTLINEHGSPLIPMTVQTVDKDVCLGYIQRNKKPISMMVEWYIKRIAQVEMVINTNLQLHKMPFLIPLDDTDESKARDAVQRILNNELVLFVDGVDPNLFKSVATEAPYIIDKLCDYKVSLENELRTYLGIDNNGVEKQEQLQLSEVNANNDEIMDSQNSMLDSLNEWCDNIYDTFGIAIAVETTSKPIEFDGEEHDLEEKPGPKEGEAGE